MIRCVDFLRGDDGICKISLEPIPAGILLKFLIIDRDLYIALHREELVVAPFVYVVLGEGTPFIGLFKPAYAFVAVVCILARPVFGVAYQKPLAVTLVVLHHPAVNFGLFQYPFLYLFTLVLYFCPYNVFVAVALKLRNIIIVHQSGVCYHDKILKIVLAHKFRDNREHGVSLILIAFVD